MRNGWVRAMEGSAITLFTVLVLLLVWHLGHQPARWWMLVLGALAGYAGADFASGLVHWFCDNFFREDSPLIGPLLIHPFREHHRDPEGMTTHGFLELTGNSCLAMIPLLFAAARWRNSLGSFSHSAILVLCAALFATNLFHKWAHASSVPRAVRWFQRLHLILTPDHPRLHHQDGYAKAYCITTGWMSRGLDYLVGIR